MEKNICCFIGHRRINDTDELRMKIIKTVEGLITDEGVDTFLFGSRSQFDSLCLELVSKLKEKYPQIKRVYVRAEFPYINDDYLSYLLKCYDETYYPEKLHGAGRAAYIERNREMIDRSKFCVFYYNEQNDIRKSGTELAHAYAAKKQKRIIKC